MLSIHTHASANTLRFHVQEEFTSTDPSSGGGPADALFPTPEGVKPIPPVQ